MIRHLLVLLITIDVLLVHSQRFYLGSDAGPESATFGSVNLTTHLGASNLNNKLQLATPDIATGVVVYPRPVTAHLGFSTSFVWNLSNCSTSVNLLSDTNYSDG